MYAIGMGVTEDSELACDFLSMAAKQGNSAALFSLDLLNPDEVNGPRISKDIASVMEELLGEVATELRMKRAP